MGLLAIGAGLIGSAFKSSSAKKASRNASDAQIKSTQMGIDEQRAQFEAIQQLLSPFVQAGTDALSSQQALIGLGGDEAQQAAISNLEQSPQFQSMLAQGENSILQNASATGGLRGGNTQGALAQFSPALLSDTIQNQFQNLSGITSLGQNAAAAVGNAGQQTGANISNLFQQQGNSRAGNALSVGEANQNLFGDIGGAIGKFSNLFGRNTQSNNDFVGPPVPTIF